MCVGWEGQSNFNGVKGVGWTRGVRGAQRWYKRIFFSFFFCCFYCFSARGRTWVTGVWITRKKYKTK